MADHPVRRTKAEIKLPPAHEPMASPSMKTESTTESTGE